jgi:hypothetical protein
MGSVRKVTHSEQIWKSFWVILCGSPFHPRNPRQQSKHGQTKDDRARLGKMRTPRSAGFLLLLSILLFIPATSFAQFGIAITIAPPPLVVYAQPVCPQEGYLWTPGYWARSDEGYYWVPGTWVEPPAVGLLWTPGYWGWGDGAYSWNEGYWGPQVGFYGGVNYGFGYDGVGYQGGYWHDNQFRYNTYVNNVRGRNFHNTYRRTVANRTSHVSYNGGSRGINARPSAAQQSAARGHHDEWTAAQSGHERDASQNHELLASVNHGHPMIAATSRPGEFSGEGVVAARGATAENRTAERSGATTRVTENKANENRAAANRATENKANENRAAENRPAPRAQPAVRAEAPRPEVEPVRASPSERPARQAAPSRRQSAPRAAAPQRQAAPRQAAAPRPEQARQSEPKPAQEQPERR